MREHLDFISFFKLPFLLSNSWHYLHENGFISKESLDPGLNCSMQGIKQAPSRSHPVTGHTNMCVCDTQT